MAKQLMTDAGHGSGVKTKLNAIEAGEVPQYAQVDAERGSGDRCRHRAGDPGPVDLLRRRCVRQLALARLDHGPRRLRSPGRAERLLGAPLLSDGTWNAAHFKNPQYDDLVRQFFAGPDLQVQKDVAGKIQTLLLDETPIIFAVLLQLAVGDGQNVQGVVPTAIDHLFVDRATKS